ncbi:MAG TPA: class I SAM-dependent methyltransferase [Candidatus Dormibacteraeota bacterium]|nr:class I SAM-dependent methyltransferase [Candidatus Dormibacteraeota bacterium]
MTEAERIAQAYRSRDQGAVRRWDLRNAGNRQILAERRRLTTRLLDRAGWLPLAGRRVLDVGSGTGAELAWFREVGARDANLVGIDLLPERVEAARKSYPGLEFRAGNAERLPFPDSSFDLVVACTLFSSILDEGMAASVAGEIQRVMRPGGGLLWYDFRYDSPSNPNVRGVGARRVRSLFPNLTGELIGLTLLPPLARRLGPLTPAAYPVLVTIPPLRSHLCGLLRKAA